MLREVDCASAAQRYGVDEDAVVLLVARGIQDLDAIGRALRPRLRDLRPPVNMAGFDAALDILVTAIRRRWRVGVYGDYDVDGVSTAAILTQAVESFGLDVVPRVAHREEGYGLTEAAARRFHEAGVSLLLVGDCGTSDHEALQWLQQRGVATVVIDHHQVPERMPPATALINPHRADCGFAFKGLCSAGVGFYLAAALRTEAASRGFDTASSDPRALLDLAALATICDMVPLVDENRVLVRHGLHRLSVQPRPGLRALIEQARIAADRAIDEEHVAFQLGPRLNAAGRIGSAEPAFRLLRSRGTSDASPLAERLESFNLQRRGLQQQVIEQAAEILDRDPRLAQQAGIVVADPRWAHGVVGIAAAELTERYRRPVAVIAIDDAAEIGRGSVRTIAGVDVRQALAECQAYLLRFGGHQAAAGLSVHPSRIAAFAQAFADAVARQATSVAEPGGEVHDGEIGVDHVGPELLRQLLAVGPYGVGFPAPRFLLLPAAVERKRVIKERHVSLTLVTGKRRVDAIWFGSVGQGLETGMRVSGLVTPLYDAFRGRVQLRVHALWRQT